MGDLNHPTRAQHGSGGAMDDSAAAMEAAPRHETPPGLGTLGSAARNTLGAPPG
ncbi:hypothetical protein LO772_25945 [Yinghuangia sp. ASG 101]|uniref:hypothetical protein n=1 Tax=Yinghuangia sp. ASG 101 TaxID=2896848 RepID=UPI001E56E75E|nr:hypothetical protein [Yinghuangia sp. ASG 101]UGQ10285.1 hypothetical protein LO772_25945 [Yinghuangia sp. ASG 101]